MGIKQTTRRDEST